MTEIPPVKTEYSVFSQLYDTVVSEYHIINNGREWVIDPSVVYKSGLNYKQFSSLLNFASALRTYGGNFTLLQKENPGVIEDFERTIPRSSIPNLSMGLSTFLNIVDSFVRGTAGLFYEHITTRITETDTPPAPSDDSFFSLKHLETVVETAATDVLLKYIGDTVITPYQVISMSISIFFLVQFLYSTIRNIIQNAK